MNHPTSRQIRSRWLTRGANQTQIKDLEAVCLYRVIQMNHPTSRQIRSRWLTRGANQTQIKDLEAVCLYRVIQMNHPTSRQIRSHTVYFNQWETAAVSSCRHFRRSAVVVLATFQCPVFLPTTIIIYSHVCYWVLYPRRQVFRPTSVQKSMRLFHNFRTAAADWSDDTCLKDASL